MVAAEEAALEGCFKRWLVNYQAIAVVALLAKSLLLLSKSLLAVVKLHQRLLLIVDVLPSQIQLLLLIVAVTMLLLQLQVAVAKAVA